ncbi:MAG: hypothetical protein A4E65_01374 [Syntrophorhabdus sp. PtaU1.Bin153]|nr:MAG: hypothetical protein A4E65_01374 [Syntrophorhabdus sp. PtaU1.Bin153]
MCLAPRVVKLGKQFPGFSLLPPYSGTAYPSCGHARCSLNRVSLHCVAGHGTVFPANILRFPGNNRMAVQNLTMPLPGVCGRLLSVVLFHVKQYSSTPSIVSPAPPPFSPASCHSPPFSRQGFPCTRPHSGPSHPADHPQRSSRI